MAERTCALGCSAYSALKARFESPVAAVAELRKNGKKTVWMFGDETPEELIIAAGLQPVRLLGYYGERPNADKYLELSFGALWRGSFEAIVNGSYDGLIDYLVMENSSDLIQKISYYLEAMLRLEEDRVLPTMAFVDYATATKNFRVQQRNVMVTEKFLNTLRSWTGKEISNDEIYAAIDLCNEHRLALRRITALRRQNKILGSEAMNIIGGSFFFEKQEATALVNAVADAAESWEDTGLVTAVYTGSAQETTELYTLIEESGINIIADDRLIGDRYSEGLVRKSPKPTTDIAYYYHMRFPSSERSYVAERAVCMPKLIEDSKAQSYIIFMNHNDESYIWDYPRQRDVLGGLPTLMIEDQYYPLRNVSELKDKFASFAEKVKGAN
ncbi:MAG: 2-hydroxyacyl-CoA dehydratase family protein [Oscillospiraceae bacterium]|nr:2-hydroxyacyl-CoA dehydratase family protein [Oscillospiraceae bacterium]